MTDNSDWLALEWHGECPDCERAMQKIQQEYLEQIAQAAAKWHSEVNKVYSLPNGYPCKCVLVPVQSKRLSIWRRVWNRMQHVRKAIGG
jgi:hypothetical protein